MQPKIMVSAPNFGRPENYFEAVEAAGGKPVGGYAPAPDFDCDGLILCGGYDLEPSLYHQTNQGSVNMDRIRDEAELMLARGYLAAGKPVFGICRGLQLLNVIFGGDLIQHLPTTQLHSSGTGVDLIHETITAEGSLLYHLYGKSPVTNSSHHQAIGRLGKGLIATQWSEQGHVIEAFEHKSLPVFAVQWHPERMCCSHTREDTADGLLILRYFISLFQ